jgi:hypothetical protein
MVSAGKKSITHFWAKRLRQSGARRLKGRVLVRKLIISPLGRKLCSFLAMVIREEIGEGEKTGESYG